MLRSTMKKQVKGPHAIVLAVVMGIVFTAAGTVMVVWSCGRRALSEDAVGFVAVRATVLETGVGSSGGGGRRGNGRRTYRPEVRYEYEVGGTRYESEEYGAATGGFPSQQAVEAYMLENGIVPGAEIEAFHDQADHARSVLSKTVDEKYVNMTWAFTIGGVVFGGAGLVLLGNTLLRPSFRATLMRGG